MAGRTIGWHWPRSALGDYTWRCDYCGVAWRRSQLRRDGAGLLVCPDEGPGEDAVTLSEKNQDLTPEPDTQTRRLYDD
jgi:hypothetical protein